MVVVTSVLPRWSVETAFLRSADDRALVRVKRFFYHCMLCTSCAHAQHIQHTVELRHSHKAVPVTFSCLLSDAKLSFAIYSILATLPLLLPKYLQRFSAPPQAAQAYSVRAALTLTNLQNMRVCSLYL